MSRHLLNAQEIRGLHQKVRTPLGEGTSQGAYEIKQGAERVRGMLVRLPVNDVTRPHLGSANCLTPRATRTALFTFQEGDLL